MATLQTGMAAQNRMQTARSPPSSKRKFQNDSNEPFPNKRRAPGDQPGTQTQHRAQNTMSQSSTYSQVYHPLLERLNDRFDVKAMSVMPSTSISKHVDRALDHLGRFSPWDQSVRPGVVLLCAKSAASSKLITIAELIRRRISESEQKWFQYNLLSETVMVEAAPAVQDTSVVEDTIMADGQGRADDTDDEYFETMQPTIHEEAVQPAKIRYKAHITVLLSRIPLADLRAEPCVSMQSNEQTIEHLWKKKMGLVG